MKFYSYLITGLIPTGSQFDAAPTASVKDDRSNVVVEIEEVVLLRITKKIY